MSTDHPPLDDLDLSAVLDHEADDTVADRLSQDPDAQLRLEQLRTARDAVAGASVADLPPDTVDALIAAAVAAADEQPDHDDVPGPEVVPVPLSRRRRPVPQWAVAAVVVVLVGLGLSLVWSGRDDDSDMAFQEIGSSIAAEDPNSVEDMNAAAEAGADAAAGTAEDGLAEEATATDGDATTTAPSAGVVPGAPNLVFLGEFTDADALRVHLRDTFPTESVEMPDGFETGVGDDLTAAFRCLGKVDGLFEPLGEPTAVGLAAVAGEPTVVYELPFRTDDGRETSLVIAVDEISCVPVLSFQR